MLTTNFTRDFLNLQDVEIENIENLDNSKRIYVKLREKRQSALVVIQKLTRSTTTEHKLFAIAKLSEIRQNWYCQRDDTFARPATSVFMNPTHSCQDTIE